MGRSSSVKHDRLVEQLINELAVNPAYSFDRIGSYEQYFDEETQNFGEVDVYTVKGREMDIYEVKSSKKHKNRGRQQLKRAKEHFSEDFDLIKTFLYLDGKLEKVD